MKKEERILELEAEVKRLNEALELIEWDEDLLKQYEDFAAENKLSTIDKERIEIIKNRLENTKREKIKLEIDIKPFSKQRPVTINKNGKTWTFTPKETVKYEKLVKTEFLIKFGRKYEKDERAIILNLDFYKLDKKLKENEIIYDTKQPDIDNLEKAILDALNKVAFKDDNQVCRLISNKYRASFNKVVISIIYEIQL